MLDAARFRIVSPVLQMLSVMALVLLMLHYLKYGDSIQAWLANPGMARWLPPLWFLGIYEKLLHGANAPVFAAPFAACAFRATAIAALVVVLTYPLAWARMRRMAVEGASRPRQRNRRAGSPTSSTPSSAAPASAPSSTSSPRPSPATTATRSISRCTPAPASRSRSPAP